MRYSGCILRSGGQRTQSASDGFNLTHCKIPPCFVASPLEPSVLDLSGSDNKAKMCFGRAGNECCHA